MQQILGSSTTLSDTKEQFVAWMQFLPFSLLNVSITLVRGRGSQRRTVKGFLQGRKRGDIAGECPVYLMNLRMEQTVCLHGFVGQQGQEWQLSASLAGTAHGSL